MNQNTLIMIVVVLVLLAAGYFVMNRGSDTTTTPETGVDETLMMEDENNLDTDVMVEDEGVMMEGTSVVLNPDEENVDVAQSGSAVLEETTAGLTVNLNLVGYQSDVPQPAHIHTGVCPDVGGVVYPLEDVVDGVSNTILPDVSLSDLEEQLPLAINVHKSAEEASTYTSCGMIEL